MMLKTLPLSDPYNSVSFREAGTAHASLGTPLVFLHGVGMQSAAWDQQIETFAQSHHVIAFDLPGHGCSAPLGQGATLADYLDWFCSALDALNLPVVSLAGHSMGALIAGGMAVRFPERLERVALLNGVFCRDDAARVSVKERAEMIKAGSFDTETPLARWFGTTPAEIAAREKVAAFLAEVKIDGYATAYAAFAGGDATYADGFGEIRCPLLALTGALDPNSTPAMSHAMANAAPLGRAVIIEEHRHMVNMTAPDFVNAALEEWLQTPAKEKDFA